MAPGNEANRLASHNVGSVLHSFQRLFGPGAITALSEDQLLERFIAHKDQAAFEAILDRHGPMVLGVCRRVLDNPHDVDDAFQATFLILIRKARSIRDRTVLGTWLYGVARRVAVRARVEARRRRCCELKAPAEADVNANDRGSNGLEARELRSLIDAELERLPQRYRTPIILCDLEGQSHEQAAMQLRCPVGTIKSRLARGRERLGSRLTRRGVAPTTGVVATLLAAERASAVPTKLLSATIRSANLLSAGQAITAGACSTPVASLCKGVITSMALSQWKSGTAAAAVCVALGAVVVLGTRPVEGQAPPPAPKRTAPPVVVQEKSVERFELENGLKVNLRPVRGAKGTALVVLYSIAGDHDPDGQSGLGHLVEHLYLTAAAGKSKARTTEELMSRYPDGANGQTGDRYTVFATTFPEKDLDAELRDAAARMSDLRMADADLAEKQRLLEEVGNMFEAFPPLAAQNNARELIRPTPRGGRRGGLASTVKGLKLSDVQAYWKRYYRPRNATLTLAGAMDPAAAREAIREHFSRIEPGEPAPPPAQPGKANPGTLRPLTVEPASPNAQPMASLAYAAPQPDSDLYAPFLVLVSRLWSNAGKLGGGSGSFPVYFTPLDDGAVVAVTAPAKAGETPEQAQGRLERFVAETIEPPLQANEHDATLQQTGFILGTIDLPDEMLGNLYGVAFSLGRRQQLGIDPAALKRELAAVTDKDLRRVATEVFAPARHAGVFLSISR